MKDAFAILSPGSYTTVQDGGRLGYQHMGVPVSGVLDSFAARVANWLVGNSADEAVLEMTILGPSFKVLGEADIAVTGAEMSFKVDGVSAPGWRSVRVEPGNIVQLGLAQNGCRSYLAVTGGVDVPMVLGSRSTYVSGGLGGMVGRPLKEGDVIKRGQGALLTGPRRLPWFPRYSSEISLRVVLGPHDDCFLESREVFFSSSFTVSAHANRMGYRLQGPPIIRREGAPKSLISEPVAPGNVQIPADGQPIILLLEQTMGGYTSIATVISPDLFRIAQAKPGDTVKFANVTLEEAHVLYREWEQYLVGIEALLLGSP